MDDASERWLPVPIEGCEGYYEVSDLGRARSLDHRAQWRGQGWYVKRGRILKATPTTRGYLHVTVSSFRDGKRKHLTPLIHRLVLEAFVGPCPEGQEARHGPGGQLDNRLVNLCYGTKVQNAQDKRRDGTYVEGTISVNAKLTEDIVRECRSRYAAGDGDTVSLAREFGVSQYTMWRAIHRKAWQHVA
jgi:hypothetical protein